MNYFKDDRKDLALSKVKWDVSKVIKLTWGIPIFLFF